jgi:hypothetical protein
LHIFINKAILNGFQLRNMVIEDLEKKTISWKNSKRTLQWQTKTQLLDITYANGMPKMV